MTCRARPPLSDVFLDESAMTARQHADHLVAYFSRLADVSPGFADGLRLASEWRRLLEADAPSATEIEALASDVVRADTGGCGLLDLRLGVSHWAEHPRPHRPHQAT